MSPSELTSRSCTGVRSESGREPVSGDPTVGRDAAIEASGNGARRRRPRVSYGRMHRIPRQAYRAASGVPSPSDMGRWYRNGGSDPSQAGTGRGWLKTLIPGGLAFGVQSPCHPACAVQNPLACAVGPRLHTGRIPTAWSQEAGRTYPEHPSGPAPPRRSERCERHPSRSGRRARRPFRLLRV